MDKFDRFQLLHRVFTTRKRPVPLKVLAEKLECTEGSAKRLIHQLRDYWQAPLEYDSERRGWYYHPDSTFELPGLWLTAAELQSLTALLHLIDNIGEGMLGDELQVVERSIHKLIQARGIDPAAIARHIKYFAISKRQTHYQIFATVAESLLKKRQLTLLYRDYRNQKTTRTVSPQTLVYYRENWHLDAWCHLRNGLRTFALSRIQRADPATAAAKEVPASELASHFADSFGIFSGPAKHQAKLRFYPEVARDLASQQWHPQQVGEWEGQNYLLTIPYNQDAELIMEILKYGNNVEVLAPATLRARVKDKLRGALQFY